LLASWLSFLSISSDNALMLDEFGQVFNVYFYALCVAQFLVGLWVDRYPMNLSALILAMSSLSLVASYSVSSFLSMLILVVQAVIATCAMLGLMRFIHAAFLPQEYCKVLGYTHALILIGLLGFELISPRALELLNWRVLYTVYGVFGLCLYASERTYKAKVSWVEDRSYVKLDLVLVLLMIGALHYSWSLFVPQWGLLNSPVGYRLLEGAQLWNASPFYIGLCIGSIGLSYLTQRVSYWVLLVSLALLGSTSAWSLLHHILAPVGWTKFLLGCIGLAGSGIVIGYAWLLKITNRRVGLTIAAANSVVLLFSTNIFTHASRFLHTNTSVGIWTNDQVEVSTLVISMLLVLSTSIVLLVKQGYRNEA
jgi:MFS family permease